MVDLIFASIWQENDFFDHLLHARQTGRPRVFEAARMTEEKEAMFHD